MNKVKATIINIQKEQNAALVKLESKKNIFSALMLDFDDKLSIGTICNILFKESEIMICHKDYKYISTRNKFVSKIKHIEEDSIFARIFFDFDGIEISSLITKEAKNELGLEINKEFMWFIKSNELMLEFIES